MDLTQIRNKIIKVFKLYIFNLFNLNQKLEITPELRTETSVMGFETTVPLWTNWQPRRPRYRLGCRCLLVPMLIISLSDC